MNVSLEIAHLKEVFELLSSEGVVSILSEQVALLLWLLDVPENVIRKSGENSILLGLGERISVSFLEIFDEVVLLSLLEDSEFLVEDGGEVVDFEDGATLFELLKHSKTESILIICVDVPDLGSGLELLILCFEHLLIINPLKLSILNMVV